MSRDNRSLLNSRSEAKRIYAQRQEIKRLEKEKDHYKHLYSEVKKQKDDVVEYIKHEWFKREQIGVCDKSFQQWEMEDLLRMLGETDEL